MSRRSRRFTRQPDSPVNAPKQGQSGVPEGVHEVLQTPGSPLDSGSRDRLEGRFGRDFSAVRVHTDDRAAQSAAEVQARAYTVGHDVVFGAGAYSPGSAGGERTLAHELAHVVQQEGASASGPLTVGPAHDSLEMAADAAAERVAGGGAAAVEPASLGGSVQRLQRQPLGQTGPADPSLIASFRGSTTIDSFTFGESQLSDEQKKRVAEHAIVILDILKRFPDSFITIAGHTDAVGTEADNKTLGQSRAEAVMAELEAQGVPKEPMRAYSLGKTSLAVETQQPEPRNRRVEIFLHARDFFRPRFNLAPRGPVLTPPPIGPGMGPGSDSGTTRIPDLQPWLRPIPPAPKTQSDRDRLRDVVRSDPIARELGDLLKGNKITRAAYDAAIDGLTDALFRLDETIAETAIDFLPVDDAIKAALKGLAKGLLRHGRGEKWTQPPQPRPGMPEPLPPFPKLPGEFIFPGPKIPFDFL